jgi:hypothetical protein
VLIVVRMDTGRMNIPNRPGTPKRPPRPEAEAELSRESISPPMGKPPLGGKHCGLAVLDMKRNRTD